MATRRDKPRRPNPRTQRGLRDFVAEKLLEMGERTLEGRDASAFAAMVRQLALLNRELAAAAAEKKQPKTQAAAGGPDFAAMSEAEIFSYLSNNYDGGGDSNVVPLTPAKKANA